LTIQRLVYTLISHLGCYLLSYPYIGEPLKPLTNKCYQQKTKVNVLCVIVLT